jgi:glycosyltransferase involved in cell wall biosynthesis
LKTWQGENVVSLQGVINGYSPYQYGGLSLGDLLLSFSPTQMLCALALVWRNYRLFRPRLAREVESIALAKNFLGRTTWDRAHAYAMNPLAPYFWSARILRSPFYKLRWKLEERERYSLFVGNSGSALKGAHYALRAVALLRKEFPKIRLYIAGVLPNPTSWKDLSRRLGYPAYLRNLVRELEIENHVEFTGTLQEEEMAKRLSRVHAYVLCSTIENSPNTLGEAMIMGVPAVTAYVGGVPDMAVDGKEALFYRDNDPQLLAYQIRRLFKADDLAQHLSVHGRKRAMKTHDPDTNARLTAEAYRQILSGNDVCDDA